MTVEELTKINLSGSNGSATFEGYLEESDISFDLLEIPIPFWSLNFKNGTIPNRVTQKVKFSFNVYSTNLQECENNYTFLNNVIDYIKPSYINNEYKATNNTGFFKIKASCLPIADDEVLVHLTSFLYEPHKEMGYIENGGNNSKMIPLAYKITLEGNILQSLEQTILKEDIKWR